MVNDGDKESDIQAGKAVADEMLKWISYGNLKTSLLRKEFRVKGEYGGAGQKKKNKLTYVSLMH